MRVLVTGSSTFFATRLIHEFGRRGAEVTAADSCRVSAGKSSRFTTRRLMVPPLGTDPDGYLETVIRELDRRPYDLLLPTFEESLLFAEYQSLLKERTQLFLPTFETMMQVHHKPQLHALCQQLDLPTPHTIVPRNLDHLQQLRPEVRLPAVLKLPTGNNSVGRTYCDDWSSLIRNYTQLTAIQQKSGAESPFVQQRIQGDLIFTLCLCHEGSKLGEVIYRTLRTFPAAGGTAAHRESIDHDQISRITERLVAETRWTGFLGLDFIVERGTGIPLLIDANPRSNPAVHLGFLAGIDWAELLCGMLTGQKCSPHRAQAGINSHSLLLDLGWVFEGLPSFGRPLWTWPGRIQHFINPGWPVHSRDDLLGVREMRSAGVMLVQGFYSFFKALALRRSVGDVLLEHANYNPVTAKACRLKRLAETARREHVRRKLADAA